jgi:hypothetical protein
MPNRNGTGPQGAGPISGRGMGRCGGGRSAGNGCGLGLGLGRRGRFSPAAADDKTSALKARVAELEKRLNEKGEGK